MTVTTLARIGLLVALCLVASIAFAQQESTATTIDEKAPETGIKGWISRHGEKLTSLSATRDESGLTYSAGIVVAGSGLSGGVGYRRLHALPGGLDFEVNGTLSVRRYQEYRAAIGRLDARSSTLEFETADSRVSSLFNASARKSPGSAAYVEMRYRDYPQHTYFGTGINSLESDQADYALTGLSVEGVWQRQISSTLGVSARGGVLDLQVGTGRNDTLMNVEDRFTPVLVPGAIDQPFFVTLGGGIVHDTRLDPGAPENGRLIGVSLRRYSATNMPALSFTRIAFDARAYRHAISSRGVIALRMLVSSDLTANSGATPFYLQQSLGGGDTLRGFHSYRFRDQAIAHGTVEYRWRVHRHADLVPFLDAGTVAPGLSRLSMHSIKASPGLGIRARTSRRSIARLDWAWSSEGQRVVLGIGPVF